MGTLFIMLYLEIFKACHRLELVNFNF